MFSQGQLIFGITFVIIFIAILIYTYQKDSNIPQKYYKGSFWVLLGFIAFVIALMAIKTYLKG